MHIFFFFMSIVLYCMSAVYAYAHLCVVVNCFAYKTHLIHFNLNTVRVVVPTKVYIVCKMSPQMRSE